MSSTSLDILKLSSESLDIDSTTGQMNNDLYPIGDLQERYGLTSRQAVYDRIKALKIEPAARGKLSSDQLDKLDKLDEHLKAGGTLSDFADVAIAPLPKELAQIPQNSERTFTIGELSKLLEVLAKLTNPPEPLLHLKELERAAAAGWLLTSEQVRQLVGVKLATRKGDRSFTRGSFSFMKSGKIGNQTAWRVVKVLGENLSSKD